MAFQIIRHAFRMIFGNLGQALRASVGPYIVLIVGYLAVYAMVGQTGAFMQLASGAGSIPEDAGGVFVLALLVLVPFTLFVLAWIAVSWHRFILLEEYSGILPAVSGRPIWPYVGRSILYGLLIVLLAIPLVFVVGFIASPFLSSGSQALLSLPALMVFIAVTAVLSFVWFRIGLALPSVAVGEPITMGAAWAASRDMSGTIFGVALLLMAINGIATLLVNQISGIAPVVGVVVDLALQWTILMLGVSILTTLYGHLIEKRPLID
ncbi:hypothetical protein [Loktanella sp. Alg231-35]|uniref:hypothetical protein n=1 Tax=Loktanella sp. Alg231-35 TaxID=1922220 RepID=UPI00131F3CBD|nr:hypothetical protein [Loktanella sp. Alg231-35]